MCNSLHEDHKPIPAKGFGYKVFQKNNASCFCVQEYQVHTSGWIKWDVGHGDGFCFFLTISEAQRMLSTWELGFRRDNGLVNPKGRTIKKIEYKHGLGSCYEKNLVGEREFTIALCKEFRIIEP